MTDFFKHIKNKNTLSNFKHKIDSLSPDNDFERNRNNFIRLVVNSMENRPNDWDEFCEINIGWIGDKFIFTLSNDDKREQDKEWFDDICTMCFRFLLERDLSKKDGLSDELERAKRYILENIDLFEQNSKHQIQFAIFEMPITLFKAVANSEGIQNLRNFKDICTKAENLNAKWTEDLEKKEIKVNTLKKSLEEYENGFNFVGLHDGFSSLANEKKKELDGILTWLKILPALILLPIFIEFLVIIQHFQNISAVKDALIISIFPTISFMAIAIYYFRVLLFNYKSVKSQILQIDLRRTLCRFIQSYSKYANEMKKDNGCSLERFESVIFSGIVMDDGSLPSTFDGMEQIEKLIKAIKS